MTDSNNDTIWYHGSPLELTVLRQGSSVTLNRRLAEVFSHKPPMVSIGDDGDIKHNGTLPGFLYVVGEEILDGDVTPHPRSTIGKEWLTNRKLVLTLVGPVPLTAEEMLTEEEIRWLRGELGRGDAAKG